MKPEPIIRLTPGKRVLFLTKDPELIRKQLRGELDLQMNDLTIDDLLDDINTDAMTPAWVCFSHKPEDIARDAYAGLIVDGKRLFEHDALINGNFEVIVSGYRKGVGSSRETATQCEVWSGIRIAVAASFAPIHAGNNINQGLLMANHAMLGAAAGGRRDSDRRVLQRLRRHHAAHHPGRRPLSVCESGRARRDSGAGPEHTEAADDDGGEDPGATCFTGEWGVGGSEDSWPAALSEGPGKRLRPPTPLRQTGRCRRGRSRRRLHARVHDRAGALLPRAGVRARLRDQESAEVRRVRGSPHLRRRRGPHAAVHGQDPDAARSAARVSAAHGLPRLLGERQHLARHLPRGGARIHHRSGRLHSGHRQPHLHGRREQRAGLGRRRHRIREPRALRIHAGGGFGVDPLRARGIAAGERHGQRRDALHPSELRQGRR